MSVKPLLLRRSEDPAGAREFHVSRRARELYEFDHSLFTLSGNVVLADFHAARLFAHKMNQKKDLARNPEAAVRTSEVNAMGLLDEILHYLVQLYREQYGVGIFSRALESIAESIGEEQLTATLEAFCTAFPPRAVYRGESTVEEYLQSEHEGVPGRELALEELIMLWVSNENPALTRFEELFDDRELETGSSYREVIQATQAYFETQPGLGEGNRSLFELLLEPARRHPDSLEAQLTFVRGRWSRLLGRYLFRLLRSLDLIKEEHAVAGMGPGPQHVYEYGGVEEESERFSPDKDWMPKVVLLAKSTLVWLDQLSRSYRREIRRLDQVPDQELDRIAAQGFTGIWLIGIWERSKASKRIKQMCGNPEAEASAYSLESYEIAAEIGGWNALHDLKYRCWIRGIRLGSDMVPNHTGIDSHWVYDHPDWFVQLDYCPFPSYSFSGENLSTRPGIGIYLEDHYYDRSDAAVVFKHVDFNTGRERFIYHGNDGTSMPWNDTAQLNFLHPEAREAVVQTILGVAREFPIIRFDAAMTLSKKHYQRLWFPEPGSGGDIATRAEHGLTKEAFNRAMPEEFWREVVDRAAEQAPDTLLLAEAFWMMESYFVRTLGMHRVYNSAFMNMLKDEENDKYRRTIKNTIEFDKDILKRFVNFMNNPDEETAVVQFGNGDKYFGVATLMVTMPGLPMFGHGQIEGLAEKYGMEYRRAYWDETPDQHLIERHAREVFPLMKRRRLFADVENFLLYDLYDQDGNVNENVFAYSNQSGDDRALVLYNNCYHEASGWIGESVAYVEKTPEGGKHHQRGRLAPALGLSHSHRAYCILREQRSGLWLIRNSKDLQEQGFYVHLRGYETQVYTDIYEVFDNEYSHYAQLADKLGGVGVENIDDALKEVFLQPLYDVFFRAVNSGTLRELEAELQGEVAPGDVDQQRLTSRYQQFLRAAREYCTGSGDVSVATESFRVRLKSLLSLRYLSLEKPRRKRDAYRNAVKTFNKTVTGTPLYLHTLTGYIFLAPFEDLMRPPHGPATADPAEQSVSDTKPAPEQKTDRLSEYHAEVSDLAGACVGQELRLVKQLEKILPGELHEHHGSQMNDWNRLMMLLIAHGGRLREYCLNGIPPRDVLVDLFSYHEITEYLGFNTYEGVVWFNRERFRTLVWMLFAIGVLELKAGALRAEEPAAEEASTGAAGAAGTGTGTAARTGAGTGTAARTGTGAAAPRPAVSLPDGISALYNCVESWWAAEEASEYKVERLIEKTAAGEPDKPSAG